MRVCYLACYRNRHNTFDIEQVQRRPIAENYRMGILSEEKLTNLTSDHFWCLSATQTELVSVALSLDSDLNTQNIYYPFKNTSGLFQLKNMILLHDVEPTFVV